METIMKNYLKNMLLLAIVVCTQQSFCMQAPDWTCGTYDITTVDSDRSLFKDFKWDSIDFKKISNGTILIHPKEILFDKSNQFMRVDYSLSVGSIPQTSEDAILDTTTNVYVPVNSSLSFHSNDHNFATNYRNYLKSLSPVTPKKMLLWKNFDLEKGQLLCMANAEDGSTLIVRALYFTFTCPSTKQTHGIVVIGDGENFMKIELPTTSPIYYMKFNNDSTLLAIATEKQIFLVKPGIKPYGTKIDPLQRSNDVTFDFK